MDRKIYIGSKNSERLRDVYITINDLLEHSVMVYGEDDVGSREEYLRKSYRDMQKKLYLVLTK